MVLCTLWFEMTLRESNRKFSGQLDIEEVAKVSSGFQRKFQILRFWVVIEALLMNEINSNRSQLEELSRTHP